MADTSSIGMTWIGLAIINLCINRTKVKVRQRLNKIFSVSGFQQFTIVWTQNFVRKFVLAKILFYDTTAIPQMWIIFGTQNIEGMCSIFYIRSDIITTNCFCNTSFQHNLQ